MLLLGVMTNNRFHFGVGVSPWYEACNWERWEKRGKRMDEQIDILKGLMGGDYFGYKGEFYDIPEPSFVLFRLSLSQY